VRHDVNADGNAGYFGGWPGSGREQEHGEAARRAAKDQDPAGQIEAARQVVEAALSKADIKPEKNPDTLNRIKEELGGEQPAPPSLSSGHDFLAELARRRKDREGPHSS